MSDTPKFDPIEALAELDVPIPQPLPDAIGLPAGPDPIELQRIGQPLELQADRFYVPGVALNHLRPDQPGVNPKDALGASKVDMSVVPPAAEMHLATAMMDGAAKYGAFNWRGNAVQGRVYYAAARRHLSQWLDGENFDPVSGVHHLGHAMACCAILLDAYETGNLADNRPTPGPSGDMVRSFDVDRKFQDRSR